MTDIHQVQRKRRNRIKRDAVRDLSALGSYTIEEIAIAVGLPKRTVDRIQAQLRETERRIRRMAESRDELGGRPILRG